MALNKKMHPRNPYKTPPSFKDLVLKNDEFRKIAKIEISGKISIDFKCADSLRALTRALLKEDWGLDVILPPQYLVPTLPLRLNYILWLEDLVAALKLNESGQPVYGIDIGTGASCIYPLLAAKKNGWHLVGVEKDEKCFTFAQENISNNNLESLIKVVRSNGESIIDISLIDDAFDPKPSVFHFTMCNPPFFASEEDLEKTTKSRSSSHPRPPPNNARTGSPNEVVVQGGEVTFVLKMIDESLQIKDRVKIFSTMLGFKSSVPKVLKYLKDKGIHEIASTEFCQGRVTRWGLAWSHSVQLTCESFLEESVGAKQKPKPPLRWIIPNADKKSTYDALLERVKIFMDQLNLEYKCVIKDTRSIGFQVTAFSNTWSNQRKKRRDQLKKSTEEGKDEQCSAMASNQQDEKKPGELSAQDEEASEGPPSKRTKISPAVPLVVLGLIFREDDTEGMVLEMNLLAGSGGRESVHQIMQYMKNNMSDQK